MPRRNTKMSNPVPSNSSTSIETFLNHPRLLPKRDELPRPGASPLPRMRCMRSNSLMQARSLSLYAGRRRPKAQPEKGDHRRANVFNGIRLKMLDIFKGSGMLARGRPLGVLGTDPGTPERPPLAATGPRQTKMAGLKDPPLFSLSNGSLVLFGPHRFRIMANIF